MCIRNLHRVVASALFFTAIAATAPAQTDIALSLYGAFTGLTSGNGVTQSPANQAGGMVELRHIVNPVVGYEATYSFNRANQSYSGTPPSVCGAVCAQNVAASVPSNAHEVSGAWVTSLRIVHLTPFALAGGGILFNVPSVGSVKTISCPVEGNSPCITFNTPTSNSTKAIFVYGAGLDWGLLPHLGLRLQYRGNVYKAPDLIGAFQSTNSFTHTAEPMIGAYFRF